MTGLLDHAFIDCENLISVDWGAVEHIEASTFRNTGLQEVVLPDSVCYVADYAFADNPDLTRVHIGKNVEEIRHAAFAGDPLESVTLNDKAILEEREVNGVMMTPLFEVRNIPENLMIYGNTGGTGESFANKYHIPFMSRGFAEGYTIGGQCGDEVYWELDLNAGRIVLSGSGRTWDYTGGMNPEDNPDAVVGWPEWYVYRNYIRELVVEPGIIRIGHCLLICARI